MVHVSGPSDSAHEETPMLVGVMAADGTFWLQECARPATCWIRSDVAVNREDWR